MKILIIRKVDEKYVTLKRKLWYIKYHSNDQFLFYSQYSGKVKIIRNCKIVLFSESLSDPAHRGKDSRSRNPRSDGRYVTVCLCSSRFLRFDNFLRAAYFCILIISASLLWLSEVLHEEWKCILHGNMQKYRYN